jgi:hypothetical protein
MRDPRIVTLAAQPFIRPGAVDFDMAYANAVWDARERVELWDLIDANPGQSVVTGSGRMGWVPA